MAKIKKKGTSGAAKNYVTRSQAVRKLQISLPDFRRLCIFKGIYPREPRQKKKVNSSSTPLTTFYYAKDIQYLLHEPLLARFREHKAVAKKIAKSLGRGEVGDAARHERRNSKRLPLDHIIKERYPTFVDALRDLDDALSLLFLFANLPSSDTVPSKTIALCQRLCLEFEHYLITTHSLRKSFLSIKGIYYQATIQGQDIMWLAPYKFVQRVTGDIDFRIMGTFVEFYTTLLGFVNYRLYTSIGLVYPPKFNSKSEELGGELSAFMLEGKAIDGEKAISNGVEEEDTSPPAALPETLQKQIQSIQEPAADPTTSTTPNDEEPTTPQPDTSLETFPAPGPDGDILPTPAPTSDTYSTLFANTTIYLSRETPKSSLEFLLRAFGCTRIGWPENLGDGAYTHDEYDPSITHQVVDRPLLPTPPPDSTTPHNPNDTNGSAKDAPVVVQNGSKHMLNRIYIQPQYIWDSINALTLLRTDTYAPGADLPPHLSPWVKPRKGGYDPTIPLREQEPEGEAEDAAVAAAAAVPEPDSDAEDEAVGNGVRVAETEDDEEEEEEEERDDTLALDALASESAFFPTLDTRSTPSDSDAASSFGGFDSDQNAEEDDDELIHQRQLELEATGADPTVSLGGAGGGGGVSGGGGAAEGKSRRRRKQREKEEEEELERRKGMMSRKKRKVFEKMVFSNKVVEGEAERLRAKRRRVEGAKHAGAGDVAGE